jgi:multidrug efflux system membrane fusion protein
MGLLLLLPLSLLAAGCNQAPPERPRKPAEVVVTMPTRGEVVDYQDFSGRLDGFRNIEVRSRVSGYITEAPFKEGDYVHEGDLLFQIDPRPYQAVLNQAEAQVHLQEAQLKYQEALYNRNVKLMQSGQAVSIEDVQLSRAQRDTTKAQLEAARAAVENARLNLSWTKVTAPLSGRVSRRAFDPWNLITADNVASGTALTTLVSDNQLYAYFDVDERTYLDLVAPHRTETGRSWLIKLKFPVLMSLANEGENFEHTGTIDFIDNRVVATTGTIRMRGVFDNASGLLKAGLFGRFRLPLRKPYQALLVPGEALQSDQGRSYVWVVGADNKAVRRYLTLGLELKGMRVVMDGIHEGERVIVEGVQRVREGAEVEAKERPAAPPLKSPLVRLLATYEAEQRAAQQDGKQPAKPADTEKKETSSGVGHTAG